MKVLEISANNNSKSASTRVFLEPTELWNTSANNSLQGTNRRRPGAGITFNDDWF